MRASSDRHRRRRLLYLVGLVPALLLLVVSGRIALMLHDQAQAMAAYRADDFDEARDHFERNRWFNPIEPWIAPFGEGDAHYREEDFDEAVVAFEAALDRVPAEHECVVRVNLALTHEEVGDSLLEDDRTKAIEAWLEAREVIRPCKELAQDDKTAEQRRKERRDKKDRDRDVDRDQDQDRDQKRDRSRDRDRDLDSGSLDQLEQKSRLASVQVDRRLARKLGLQDQPVTRPPDDAPPDDEETREKRRRLEERNKKALKDNVEHKDEFGSEPPPPPPQPEQPPPTPQW